MAGLAQWLRILGVPAAGRPEDLSRTGCAGESLALMQPAPSMSTSLEVACDKSFVLCHSVHH